MGLMDRVSTRFSDVQPAGPLPGGEYTVTIEKFETKPSKSGDSDYSAITYTVDEPVESNGKKIFDNVSWHENALQFSIFFIMALLGVDDPEDIPDDFNPEDNEMIGQRLGVVIIEDEYNGRKQNKVVSYFSV